MHGHARLHVARAGAGKPADARSDIFAFGADPLRDALGPPRLSRRLGRRHDVGDPERRPAGPLRHQPFVSPGLERIVRHCLEKNPEQRFQSAQDLVFHLQSISADTGSAVLATLPPLAPKRRWVVPALTGAVAALALAAAATLILRPPRRPPQPISRFSIRAPEGVSLADLGTQSLPAISPDGRRMAFTATDASGKTGLWVRSFSDLEARRIVEATDAVGQVGWSADGRQLVYFARSGSLLLKRVPADGGPATAITDAGPRGMGVGVTWGREGTILFGVWAPEGGIFRVPEGGGTPVAVVKTDTSRGELLVASPMLLPGGRHFLYVVRNRDWEKSGIHVRALDGKDARRLFAAESQTQYVEPGYLLFMRQRTLFAQRFDAGRLTLEGAPVALAQGVWKTPQTWRGGFSGVADVLVYSPVRPAQSKLLWHDRTGTVLGEVPAPDGAQSPEFSPAGDRLLVDRREPGSGNSDIWILEPRRGTATRFTFDAGDDLSGVWSPDGASVYFSSNRSGRLNAVFRKPSSGDKPEEEVADDAGLPNTLSPDGSTLVVMEALNLWLVRLAGGGPRVPLIETPAYSVVAGQISPDGRHIAYMSDETGQHEIYVQAFPPPGGKWQISNKGGMRPRWRPDGRELYYIAPDRKLMAAEVETSGGFRASTPRALFQTRISGPLTGDSASTTPSLATADSSSSAIRRVWPATASSPSRTGFPAPVCRDSLRVRKRKERDGPGARTQDPRHRPLQRRRHRRDALDRARGGQWALLPLSLGAGGPRLSSSPRASPSSRSPRPFPRRAGSTSDDEGLRSAAGLPRGLARTGPRTSCTSRP